MQKLLDPVCRLSAGLRDFANQVHFTRVMDAVSLPVLDSTPGTNSLHSPDRQLRRFVTRLSQHSDMVCITVTDALTHMVNYLDRLGRRARRCPFACFLKVLFIASFAVALDIAVYYQGAMSFHEYSAFVMTIAYVAVIAIVTNTNCRLTGIS